MKNNVSTNVRKRSKQRTTVLSPVVAASVLSLGVAVPAARADTFNWAGATGNVSDPAQWLGGIAPTGLGANDVYTFGDGAPGTTPAPYVVTNDLPVATQQGLYFGTINLNTSVDGSSIVGGAGNNPGTFPNQLALRAVNANATINQNGAGAFNLAQPIAVGPNATLTVNVAAGAGQLALANFSGTSALQTNYFFGPGNLVFNNNSANAVLVGDLGGLSGNLTVNAGIVRVADSVTTPLPGGGNGTGGGDVVRNQTLVTVNGTGTFDFNQNGETMGGIAGNGTIRLGASGGIGFNYDADLRFDGSIISLPNSTSAVTKDVGSNNSTYTYTGTNAFSGKLTVNSGTMLLTGNWQNSGTSGANIANGAKLVLDNSTQNVVDRINNTSAMSLAGTLSLVGAPGAASSQTLGAVSVATSGASQVNTVNGANGGTAAFTFNTLTRSGRGSYVDFTGNGTVTVNSATQTGGIITFATVNGADWATLDASNHVVPLPTYQTSADPTTWAASDNVKITGPLTGSPTGTQVNSLNFTTNDALTLNGTLKVTGGGILSTGGGSISGGTIVGGQSSNAEVLAVVNGANPLTINSVIGNTPGNSLTKVGNGTLILTGANTFGTAPRVYGGVLSVSSDANLGNGTSVTIANATLQITDPSFNSTKSLSFNGVNGAIDTGTNTVTFTPASTNGAVLGTSGSWTKTGTGTLVFAGANGLVKNTGNVHVAQGVLQTGQGDTFGNSTVITVDAGAALDLSFDTSGENLGSIAGDGEVRVLGTSGITLENGDDANVVFNGRITPYLAGQPAGTGGSLTKNGVGNITLGGTTSDYSGKTAVNIGSITITADALPNTPGPLGNSSAPVTLGNTTANDNNNAALLIGAAGVTLGRDIVVQGGGANQTGALTLGSTHTSGTSQFTGSITVTRPVELTAAAGATTAFNGPISGAGSITKVGGGTVTLNNGGNSYTGGTFVADGTLVINDDPSSLTSALPNSYPIVNGAQLVINSTSAIASSVTGGGTTTINAGGNLITGDLAQFAVVNNGSLTVNGVAKAGPVTGSGSVSFNGPSATVARFAQSAVNVSDGVTLTLTGGTAATSTTPTLNLNNSGTLDLASSAVALNYGTNATLLPQVKQWVLAGRNGGVWTGGTGITSSAAAANPSHVAVGFLDGGSKGTPAVPANTVLARATWVGDANLDGKVDSTDVNAIVQRGQYNTGHAASWADGDFNFDGLVTSQDINAIVQAGQYLKPAYSPAATGSAQPSAAKTLTARSASPATAAPGTPGDGQPDFQYDPATGDVTFVRDGLDPAKLIQTLTLRSAGNKFITGVGYTSQNNSGVDVDQTDEQFASRFGGIAKTTPFTFDLGDILPKNLTLSQLQSDLSVNYDYQGDGATGDGIPAGVTVLGAATPEPAALSLLAVGSGALLARRRRRAK